MGTISVKMENEWVYIEIRGHYIYVRYKPNTLLDLDAAKKILQDAVDFSGDKIYPALTDIREMPAHSKEVRDYFAIEGSETTFANAIIVSSSFSRILANFFLTLNKPKIPTRIFSDSAKAAKWLEMFPVKAREVLV
ncbi:MAG TPA: hypothetical protein VK766_08635 [Cytophagaceae bacterium]|jgi:hypothetical protein|nr:hypothetical protein [Cytophagaceae bacterium]